MTVDLEAADELASEVHAGQTRAQGTPYIEHPRAVRSFVEHLAAAAGFAVDDGARAVALLHDVVEDGAVSAPALAERFGAEVARRVELLSKQREHTEKETRARRYFARLAAEADDVTRLVKVADRLHNLMELPLVRDGERQRRYLGETAREIVPLARGASHPALARALEAAARDGVATCTRLCGLDEGETRAGVPRGVYVIVDVGAGTAVDDVLALVDAAGAGGAALLQVRGKHVTDRKLLAVVEGALPSCRAVRVPLVVNDRADVALVVGADGVHVGAHDLPAVLVRRLLPLGALLGASSHTKSAALELAASDVLDYLAFGPVYPSPTKRGHADVTGASGLTEVVRATTLPVCAIGGITSPSRMAEVARAGAALGAVISAVASAEDPLLATRALGIAFAAGSALFVEAR